MLQGTGLSPQQAELCDSFVYIEQYGAGTASLNVSVAASIVLHHFALWAGYQERSRHGEKYDVGERPVRRASRGLSCLFADITHPLRIKVPVPAGRCTAKVPCSTQICDITQLWQQSELYRRQSARYKDSP